MSTAIEFNNISKQYRLGLVSTRTLSHDLNRWWTVNVLRKEDPYLKIGETNDRSSKGSSDYVWALKDIDFKVEQGDVVGIIGKNGAGKSTLLKLLSKVTGPTTGTIRARGRIGSLLEVGTGFHPEMTGRENIFMNGAILGMNKKEIQSKLDEIVDFSGCERYIDTPVKRYSSGMMVRLGFAVAAHLDPEILVVDEVLAVGDAEFQKKAIGKMQDVSKGEGRTVLFVSHNMESISTLCKSCVLLDKGGVSYIGGTDECIDRYYSSINGNDSIFDIERSIEYCSRDIRINSIKINGKEPSNLTLQKDNKINYDIEFNLNKYHDIYISAFLLDNNTIIASYSSKSGSNSIYRYDAGTYMIHDEFLLPEQLVNGEYYVDIVVNDTNSGVMLSIPRVVKIIKQGFISKYSGVSFTKSNSGYFAIIK